MSDLCLLTASLLMQGKLPGWQAATPPTNFWTRLTNPASIADRMCNAAPTPTTIAPSAVLNRPAFSGWIEEVSVRQFAKPRTGTQLYAQRLAALRSGRLYTRLASDSFQAAWEGATYHPHYEDWIKLLDYEAKAIAQGQGSQRLSILLGDSLAQWFPSDDLSHDRFWLNQGISGETTGGLLKRLSVLDHTNPESIYLMVGINDVRKGVGNREILKNLTEIVQRLKAAHPQTQIYVNSILPTRLEAISKNRIRRLNYNIAALSEQEGVHFVNLQPAFADPEGHLQVQLTTDGLHLNGQGYRTWQLATAPVF